MIKQEIHSDLQIFCTLFSVMYIERISSSCPPSSSLSSYIDRRLHAWRLSTHDEYKENQSHRRSQQLAIPRRIFQ